MTVSSANRTALFIDGANLYSTAKALGFDIDYKRLLKVFQSHGTLVRAFYYTAVTEDQEFSSVRPLLDSLERPTPREASLHSHYVRRRTSLKGGQTPGNFKG